MTAEVNPVAASREPLPVCLNLSQASQAGARDYIRCRVTVCCGLCTLIGLLSVSASPSRTSTLFHRGTARFTPDFTRMNGGYLQTVAIRNITIYDSTADII